MKPVKNNRSLVNALLLVQVLAGFTQWLDIFLIFSIPSFAWNSKPSQIALLAALFGLPSLLLGPFFGAFLDRADPRRLMVVGIVARVVLTLVLALAPWFWLFAVLVLAKGLANLVYWPAAAVLTHIAVPEPMRLNFFSSLSFWDQLCKVGAPLIAGLLAIIMPAQYVLLVSVATSLIILFLLPDVFRGTTVVPVTSIRSFSGLWNGLLQGWISFQILPRFLIFSMALSITMSLTLAIYDPHVPAYLDSVGLNAASFALIVSATAAGATAAALFVKMACASTAAAPLIRGGVFIFSVAVVAMAALLGSTSVPHAAWLGILWFANGFGYEIFMIGTSVNFQNLCPTGLLGRISTSLRSLQMAAVVSGPSIGAWMIDSHGRRAPFVAAAGVAVLLLMAVAFRRHTN